MRKRFSCKDVNELKQELDGNGIVLPLSEDVSILGEEILVCGKKVANRIAIQPMEGCDGELDGAPSDLTKRRYSRFAKSGAGLIWFEAVAVVNEGRANPRQLFLNEATLNGYKELVANIKSECLAENGFEPLIIMQATHSGRYSKPNGTPVPIIAYNNPVFEKDKPISADRIVSDEELMQIEKKMGEVAHLAELAGFDGVDIKCCHRYLNSELLSAFTRKGLYGTSLENRTRFLKSSIKNAQAATKKGFIVTTRINIYDGFPYPYGFGVNEKDGLTPDLTEPLELIGSLHNQLGVDLIDITIGNPYVNPHVNRPADVIPYECEENPLVGVERMLSCIKQVQQAYPKLCVIGSGLTYLRHLSANLAAGAVADGYFTIAGFGRQSFAYPSFASDIIKKGALDPKKCCITCSKCTELMRAGSVTGCVVKDSVYSALTFCKP